MFDFKKKIVEAIQGMPQDFIQWALLMCNDLLLKKGAEIQFFSTVNNFLLAITSTIALMSRLCQKTLQGMPFLTDQLLLTR
ncbi:hypothetical protein [Bacillus cereus]